MRVCVGCLYDITSLFYWYAYWLHPMKTKHIYILENQTSIETTKELLFICVDE